MRHVPCKAIVTPGYDVSHWQDTRIHEKMRVAGKKFCVIKADEGRRPDDRFRAHYNEAKNQGMITGFYNFFHPSQDAHKQAQHILGLIGPLHNDLGAVCDLESADGMSHAIVGGAAFQFLTDVKKAMGQAMLYGSPYFLRDTAIIDSRFVQFLLWIAQYGPGPSVGPLIPDVYSNWDFWQYSETGGIDLNLYNGSLDALHGLCLKAA